MSNEQKKNLKWWLKTTGEAVLWTGAYFASDLLKLFPDHTIAAQVAIPLGFAIGFLCKKALNVKTDYQKDELPSGITNVMDKIPDSITGVKGSKK